MLRWTRWDNYTQNILRCFALLSFTNSSLSPKNAIRVNFELSRNNSNWT